MFCGQDKTNKDDLTRSKYAGFITPRKEAGLCWQPWLASRNLKSELTAGNTAFTFNGV